MSNELLTYSIILQINTNGYAVFGDANLITVRFTPIPRHDGAGSAVLIPYSTDLTTSGAEGSFLSYR